MKRKTPDKTAALLLTLICTLPANLAVTASETELTIGLDIIERRYCTQFGPFLIRFDRDKAAGIYAIVPNGHLGTMVGSLTEERIVGRWQEATSAGDIEIQGRDGWSGFVAKYRTDKEPERWHEGWFGRLQPTGLPPSFERGGMRYLCERPPGSP